MTAPYQTQAGETSVLAFTALPSGSIADTQAPHKGIDQSSRFGAFGSYEPFVDEHVIASFLQYTPRRVLEMARKGEIPAHPIGRMRKTWRFRISEIDAHFSPSKKPARATMAPAVPGTQDRKRLG